MGAGGLGGEAHPPEPLGPTDLSRRSAQSPQSRGLPLRRHHTGRVGGGPRGRAGRGAPTQARLLVAGELHPGPAGHGDRRGTGGVPVADDHVAVVVHPGGGEGDGGVGGGVVQFEILCKGVGVTT